jgi:hypothetical protein
MEVLRQETGSDGVLFFVVIPFVVFPPYPPGS